jgi:hypothetical protein
MPATPIAAMGRSCRYPQSDNRNCIQFAARHLDPASPPNPVNPGAIRLWPVRQALLAESTRLVSGACDPAL